MEQHLLALGYDCVESLRGQNPIEMYHRECAMNGGRMDRCVLYAYRCAVYSKLIKCRS